MRSNNSAKFLKVVLIVGIALVASGSLLWAWREQRRERLFLEVRAALVEAQFEEAAMGLAVLDQRYGVSEPLLRLQAEFFLARGQGKLALDALEELFEAYPTEANRSAYALGSLARGEVEKAEELLRDWPPGTRHTEPYLNLAASLAFARNDLEAARERFASLYKQSPENPHYAINLASLELRIGGPAREQWALEVLKRLSLAGDLPGRPEQVLLEAGASRARLEWVELAETRIRKQSGEAAFRLALTALDSRRIHGWEAKEALAAVKVLANTAPRRILLADWMLENGCHRELIEWLDGLPREFLKNPDLGTRWVAALEATDHQERIFEFLGGVAWPGREPIRHGYLARAIETMSASEASVARLWWRRAREGALEKPALIEPYLRFLFRRQEWEQIIKLLEQAPASFREAPTNRQAYLAALEGLGKTQPLFRETVRLWEADPDNVALRNNAAALGLLLGLREDEFIRLANENFDRHPDHPDLAATWALAHVDRDPAMVLERLEPLVRRHPRHDGLALYFGEAHRRLGKANPLEMRLHELLVSPSLFPEEKQRLESWKPETQTVHSS